MTANRQKLLRTLIEKLQYTIKEMHAGQSFPFGEYLLNQQQVIILFFVAKNNDKATLKELAKLMHVTAGAVTQFVDALVEKKLVIREEGLRDRRSINIKLTPLAKKHFKHFKDNYFSAVSRVFEDFSAEELVQFGHLIGKIKNPNCEALKIKK
ncbi:MAG: MarR family transcriptional regulator [Patescibacteria group bacterium]